jgi:ABC-type nitrate/sulfonate/bicarbonate transport system ATPase subunit
MNLSFAGKSFGPTQVLGPIDLRLAPSSVTAILGPSGSGKTTLLRLVAGLSAADGGTAAEDLRIGMAFQEPYLLPWRSLQQNVELVGPESGLLARFGLDHARSLYPGQVSLGMARRASLARALAASPDLLILDEPFASLDSGTARSLRQDLSEIISERGLTTLMVTHNAEDAARLADAVYWLKGRPATLSPSFAITVPREARTDALTMRLNAEIAQQTMLMATPDPQ